MTTQEHITQAALHLKKAAEHMRIAAYDAGSAHDQLQQARRKAEDALLDLHNTGQVMPIAPERTA